MPTSRNAFARWLVFLVALPFAISLYAQEADGPLSGAALKEALLRGGYVLYFRHAATDFGQNDERMTGYEDCGTQRNLTDRGRSDARAIGVEIKRLHIPVNVVLASPFCRTRETAQLIFGRATVDPRVRGGPARPDDPERYAELRKLLSTPVPQGTNVAIVSHGNPFAAVAGPPYLAEGEAAVIDPHDGKVHVVARIPFDAWRTLK